MRSLQLSGSLVVVGEVVLVVVVVLPMGRGPAISEQEKMKGKEVD